MDVLNEHDVPSGEILTLDAAVTQPQIEHRKTFGRVTVEGIGEIPLFNMTAKFEKTPGTVEAPPPTLGQHTRDVLLGLGYTEANVEEFARPGRSDDRSAGAATSRIMCHEGRIRMGMTVVEKILARASGLAAVKAGDVVEPAVDLAMSHENAALVINQFLEVYKGTGLEPTVWDP